MAVDLTVIQAIRDLGTIAVLTLVLLAFIRGELVSRVVFDRMAGVYEKQLQAMTQQIIERLDKQLDRLVDKALEKRGTGPLKES